MRSGNNKTLSPRSHSEVFFHNESCTYGRYYPDYSGTSVGSKPEQNVFKMFWARVG